MLLAKQSCMVEVNKIIHLKIKVTFLFMSQHQRSFSTLLLALLKYFLMLINDCADSQPPLRHKESIMPVVVEGDLQMLMAMHQSKPYF